MKYLCLVYADEKRIAALSGSDWHTLVLENLELCEELRKSGHYVSASPLDSEPVKKSTAQSKMLDWRSGCC